jgi:cytochrome c oxidase assembly protein subunit 11
LDAAAAEQRTSIVLYLSAIVVAGLGTAYAAVPLYKMFCQATGFAGTARHATAEDAKRVRPVEGAHPVTIQFAAQTADTLPWEFVPQQPSVRVVPGETALAFFTARNKSDKPVTGISTYNITPSKAGVYFNKVQCFCFDMQRLRPNEEVDMPVLFYLDPAFASDPQMSAVTNIVLSYTFFAAKG